MSARTGLRQRYAAGAFAAVLTLTLVACSGEEEVVVPTTTPQPTTSAPAPSPTPTPEPTSTPIQGGPVLAVKIDHVDAAYPRVGIGYADVVYVDEVEYGLTRLLAVFSSELPETVGPIRSARPNDPTILANWGSVPLVHSGASRLTYENYLNSGSHIDLPHGSGKGFYREGSRRAPHNLLGRPADLLKTGGGSQPPEDIGFRFGDAPSGGAAAKTVATRYPSVRMGASYDKGTSAYTVQTNGRTEIDALTGDPVAPKTIVVQKVSMTDSKNRVSAGVATPLAELVGDGEVLVLREGKVWEGTWSRAGLEEPTEFRVGDDELTFAPGPVWVWFVPREQAVTVE